MVFVLCRFFVQTSRRQTISLFTGGMSWVHSKLEKCWERSPLPSSSFPHMLGLTPNTTILLLIGMPSLTVPSCIASLGFEDEPFKGLTTEAAAYRIRFWLEKRGTWREVIFPLLEVVQERDELLILPLILPILPLILRTCCDPWLWSTEHQRSKSLRILEPKWFPENFLKILFQRSYFANRKT